MRTESNKNCTVIKIETALVFVTGARTCHVPFSVYMYNLGQLCLEIDFLVQLFKHWRLTPEVAGSNPITAVEIFMIQWFVPNMKVGEILNSHNIQAFHFERQ